MSGTGHLVDYYTHDFDEDDRLRATALGRLEFIRTKALLEQRLPSSPCAVLDVGGGTGVYAAWLQESGHAVVLLDPVPRHVEQARRRNPPVTAEIGDARQLDVPDGSMDAVLLLGPLYHLTRLSDRATALAEALRVLRPGGLLAAAAVGRYAEALASALDGVLDDADVRSRVASGLDVGTHDLTLGFTDLYLHTAEELVGELATAGFADARVFSVEGAAWPALRHVPVDANLSSHLHLAEMLDHHPAVAATADHLLAFAHAPR